MTESRAAGGLGRLRWFIHRLEDLVIAALLTATMGLALYQIVLRNLAGSGLVWGDVLVRLMVLWLGMAGAMAATRERKHISVDLVTRYLPAGARRAVESLTALFAGSVCLVAFYYSLRFVLGEYAFGGTAFAQVPFWICVSILPLGFLVIAVRYFIQLVLILLPASKAAP